MADDLDLGDLGEVRRSRRAASAGRGRSRRLGTSSARQLEAAPPCPAAARSKIRGSSDQPWFMTGLLRRQPAPGRSIGRPRSCVSVTQTQERRSCSSG
ncbi:MAG: hypothetical protein MZU95_01985 [Desulfomicrobium escambiense]|nr:hypothetical protein [Desulfomicrobium escambiense]